MAAADPCKATLPNTAAPFIAAVRTGFYDDAVFRRVVQGLPSALVSATSSTSPVLGAARARFVGDRRIGGSEPPILGEGGPPDGPRSIGAPSRRRTWPSSIGMSRPQPT
jgi:hypothetical protein